MMGIIWSQSASVIIPLQKDKAIFIKGFYQGDNVKNDDGDFDVWSADDGSPHLCCSYKCNWQRMMIVLMVVVVVMMMVIMVMMTIMMMMTIVVDDGGGDGDGDDGDGDCRLVCGAEAGCVVTVLRMLAPELD